MEIINVCFDDKFMVNFFKKRFDPKKFSLCHLHVDGTMEWMEQICIIWRLMTVC